jgi:Multicopper oxidase
MASPLNAQHFWLLGTGNGTFDAADKSQLNTVNPVNRDTATVPPYGWVAFRFLVCPWLLYICSAFISYHNDVVISSKGMVHCHWLCPFS